MPIFIKDLNIQQGHITNVQKFWTPQKYFFNKSWHFFIKVQHFFTLHVYLALHVYLIFTLFPPCTFIRHTRVGNYTISNKEIQNEKWIYKCNTYSFHTCCNIVFRQKLAALTLLFHKEMHQWKVHTDTLAKILECNKVQQNKRGNKHKSDKGLPA